jgi:hypothetical protein
MIVFINEKNEIKDVNTTTDESLVAVEVPEGTFDGWSVAKICCFKVILKDGAFVGFTPYVDTRIIEHIERLGSGHETNSTDIGDMALAILELYEKVGD